MAVIFGCCACQPQDHNDTYVVITNGTTTINGERDLQEGGLHYVNPPPSKQLALAPPSDKSCYIALNAYDMNTKRDLVQYLQSLRGLSGRIHLYTSYPSGIL